MKVLPHNEESEKAVLGAIIESPRVRNELVNKLVEADFYGTGKKDEIVPNRLVFRAVSTLVDNGAVVDLASITTELDVNMKVLTQIGGLNYIRELMDSYISDSNALYHADTIKDLALSRKLIECLDECVDGFEKKEFTDVGQYIAHCEKKILDITQARRVSEFEKTGDIVDQITAELKISRNNKDKKGFKGVSTGFQLLDFYTQGGWQPGQLNILGARPSVGKTAFSLNLAYNAAALSGGTVAFFSLEMDAKSIVKRLLANVSSINSALFANGELSDDDIKNMDYSDNEDEEDDSHPISIIRLDSINPHTEDNYFDNVISDSAMDEFIIEDESMENMERQTSFKMLVERVLDNLSNTDRRIVKKRYGIDYPYQLSINEIAENENLTPNKVKYIISNAQKIIMKSISPEDKRTIIEMLK